MGGGGATARYNLDYRVRGAHLLDRSRFTAVLNGSYGVRPEGAHHTKGFSHRDPYN